jgi:hypothetical protein
MAKHIVQVLLPGSEERSIDADSLEVAPNGDLLIYRDGDDSPPRTIAHYVAGSWCGYQVIDPPEEVVGYDKGARIGGPDLDSPGPPYTLREAVEAVQNVIARVTALQGLN